MRRFLWLLMLLLLVGSAVGAWAVNHTPGSNGDSTAAAPAELNYIFAIGHIDIDKGVTDMYPRQPGLVVTALAENAEGKKDAILLQVDDTLAQLQLQEAQDARKAAEITLEKAQLQARLYPFKLEQQKVAVAALEHKIKMVEAENRITSKAISENLTLTEDRRTMMKEGVEQVKALLQVEQAKLKELHFAEPLQKMQVAEAEINVSAKKVQEKKAEAALELYKIRAPQDGMVLRVLTRAGATLGSNPRMPAVQFRPQGPLFVRAEVLQEWGHLVKERQKVAIVDDTYQSNTWEGEVQTISKWYAPTRSPIIEPFKMNDVRTLECLIKINSDDPGLRIGQRVRVKILLPLAG
jgi:multidrug resistance efflux pump